MTFNPDVIFGVDFSGAACAGLNTWIARSQRDRRGRWHLVALDPLARLAGGEERAAALAHLVRLVLESERALWGMDFPFGLPVELFGRNAGWRSQLDCVTSDARGAVDFGRWCVAESLARAGRMHIRRATDTECKTSFDCYHYRIIHQTYHGMRQVLAPLARSQGTVIAPFHLARLAGARRVVVESCPGSTLKRWGVPHQNYKQAAGGALTPVRRRTRRRILDALSERLTTPPALARVMMRNPGGDALDAAIAAVGAREGWLASDVDRVLCHPRYRREGLLYV